MSKVNAMQAMREARYASRPPVTSPPARGAGSVPDPPVRRTQDGATLPAGAIPPDRALSADRAISPDRALSAGPAAVPGPAGTPAPAAPPALPPAADAIDPVPEAALCGHRSMNNRICRRPAGHAEKNHRYT